MSRLSCSSVIGWAVALSLALTGSCGGRARADGVAHPVDGVEQVSARDAVAGSDLPPTIDSPLDGDAMNVTIHRLSNGMTVYISTDRQQPRFNAWIAVRAGSRHDPANSTGLAHYLEHMLFKGTDEMGTIDMDSERAHVDRVHQLYADLREADGADARGKILAEIDAATQAMAKWSIPNEIDRVYTKMGVQGVNAFTSDDMTVYTVDVPSNRLEAWARVEGERFADPVFRLFYPELEAVYEEKNLSIDNPYRRVNEAMMLALFPEHPYGTQPTIGLVDHLKTPAYQDMVDYFARWYVPNNMAVVLAGDIDAETALPVLERSLGRLRPRALPRPEPGKLPAAKGRVFRQIEAEGEQSVVLAWKTVAVASEDEPAMVVMDWLMDNSASGLLNVELELTQKVPDAGSSHSASTEAGYWQMFATARDGQKLEDVEKLLLGVIDLLRAGKFTQAEIDAIVLNQDIAEKRRLESNAGRVSKMAASFWQHRSWQEVLARDRRLREVTRKDVIDAAKKYIGDDYVAVYRRKGKPDLPKIDKPKITPVDIDSGRASPFASSVLAMETTPLQPKFLVEGEDYVHHDIAAGPMIAALNQRNDLFSVSYRFDRGFRKAPLLCFALALLERSGAGDLSAEDLQRRLFALGTSVSTSCDAERSSIDVSGISKNLRHSVELVDGWFRNPQFDDDVLAKLLANVLSERKDQIEDPDTLARATTDYANFGRHSAWLLQPSNDKLNKARGNQLRRLLNTFVDHRHRTLYFGPRSADDAAKIVALGNNHTKVGDRRPRRYRKVDRPTIWFLHKDVAKSTVALVFPQKPLERSKRPVAELYSEYLGGNMSSLIFQEIREARGLAYRATGYHDVGGRTRDDSALIGRLGTQVDKTEDAVATFVELIRNRAIEPDRVAEAKIAIDESYRSSRTDPRWINRWVLGWDELGEDSDPRPWTWEQIGKLGPEQLAEFAAQFADAPIIISITGDRNRVDLEGLGKLAPVKEVEPEQLFGYGKFPAEPRPTSEPRTP